MEIGAGDQPQLQHHFVLVHGMNHGAWCWYMAVTLLRLAGHRATALDMAGCGVHPARVDEVLSFEDYSRPLLDELDGLPAGEQVVLVAHSHGGYSVALAVERFPEKVAAAIFVTASMPAVGREMAATSDEVRMCKHSTILFCVYKTIWVILTCTKEKILDNYPWPYNSRQHPTGEGA
jgi:pimeloyl-ACP methyl ester carboxylesterase